MEDYRTFWTNVTSTRVLVTAGEESDTIDPHENTGDYNDIDYDDLEISESRTLRPIRGQYPGHSGPIRGQDPGHVITLSQSEASA